MGLFEFGGVLESFEESGKEADPYEWYVVCLGVEAIKPVSNLSGPRCDLFSFDKGEGKGDLFNG